MCPAELWPVPSIPWQVAKADGSDDDAPAGEARASIEACRVSKGGISAAEPLARLWAARQLAV